MRQARLSFAEQLSGKKNVKTDQILKVNCEVRISNSCSITFCPIISNETGKTQLSQTAVRKKNRSDSKIEL